VKGRLKMKKKNYSKIRDIIFLALSLFH